MNKDFLTLKQAQQFLEERGIAVSERTVRRWHAQGNLSAFKVGNTLRIKAESLEAFIDNNTRFLGEK